MFGRKSTSPREIQERGASVTLTQERVWREATEVGAATYDERVATGLLGWDWGNVPSWVGSLLTGTSLGIAAVTYLRNGRERRRENDERARKQASLVSCWAVNPRRWLVRNGNDVAVSVQVLLDDDTGSEPVTLAPGETRGMRLTAGVTIRTPFPPLVIVDSFGRRWTRRETGELVESTGGRPNPSSPAFLTWDERS